MGHSVFMNRLLTIGLLFTMIFFYNDCLMLFSALKASQYEQLLYNCKKGKGKYNGVYQEATQWLFIIREVVFF